jgi:hypothetical protein
MLSKHDQIDSTRAKDEKELKVSRERVMIAVKEILDSLSKHTKDFPW